MTFSAVFLKQLEQLSQHDRQEVETFIGYLKSRPQKEIKQFPLPDLTQRLNKELLKGYVQETIDSLYFSFTDSCEEEVLFHMAGRNRPISFNTEWFIHSYDELLFYEDFPNKIEKLWVKYRPGTNRIDKVAFDSKYITDLGRKEGKKRILVLDNVENVEINKHDKKLSIHESLSDYSFAKNQTASEFVTEMIDSQKLKSDLITASVHKNHEMFKDLMYFIGQKKLDRIATIMVNFIDNLGIKRYSWDSEYYSKCKHDFYDISNKNDGETISVKAHTIHESLNLNAKELENIDADKILSVLVEEINNENKITICGWISKIDFVNKTSKMRMNDKMLRLWELNSPKELFE